MTNVIDVYFRFDTIVKTKRLGVIAYGGCYY